MDNISYSSESQKLQQPVSRQLSVPPLWKNISQENLEALEKELVQNPNLVNTERNFGDAPIHIATKGKHLGSLKTLLRNGAEVSLVNAVGDTALHNAVTAKWQEGITELLQHGASPDQYNLPKATDVSQTALHSAVRGGNYQLVSLLLRQSPNLSLCDGFQKTVLHMAAEAHNMKLLTHFLGEPSSRKMISQKDYKGNTVLHVAIQSGKVVEEQKDEVENDILKIVELLIANGMDVNSINLNRETPVYLATKNCLPKVVDMLMKSEADLSLVTNSNNSVLHVACESDSKDCLNILLEKGKVKQLIRTKNDDEKEPFHLAIDSGSKQCCESLLKNGDHLGNIDYNGKNRCSLILENLPQGIELLNQVFDDHVHIEKCENDPNFSVAFDYSSILRPKSEEVQCSLIPELTSSQFTQILKHPLIESFLVLKWNKLKFMFYIYVFLYFTFVMVHTYFIFSTFGPKLWSKGNWNVNTLYAIRIIHIVLYTVFLLPGTAMVLYNKHFIKDRETYYILISIGCSAFVVFSPNLEDENRHLLIERPVAALSAAVSWGELTMLLGKFPKFGQYISMLSTVATNMVKVFIGYCSLLVGFALGFAILYRDQNVFASFMHSMVKILMMMIGEYNYVEMPNSEAKAKESHDTIMYLGSVLLIMFLFVVSILMTNLFIGVAVYDIRDLIQHGKIGRLYKEAQYIISYERCLEFLNMNQMGRIRKALSRVGQIPKKTKVYPNRYDPIFYIKLPKDTIEEAKNIKAIEMGNCSQSNGETNITTIMKSFSTFYMTSLKKQHKPRELQAKKHQLLVDRLENLEKLIQSHLSKPNEDKK